MKKILLLSVLVIFTYSSELYSQEYDARYRVDGKMEVNSTSKINLDISNLSEAYSKTGIHNLGNGEYVSIDIDPKPARLQFRDYYIFAEDSARRNLVDFMKGSEFNGYGYRETKKSHQKVYGNGEVYALYKIYFKIFPNENNQNLNKRNISSSNEYYDSGNDKADNTIGQKLSELKKKADILYDSDDFLGEISILNEIIEIDPQYAIDSRIYYNRGCAKLMLNDYEGALSDFNIETPPMFADLQWRKGICYYFLGNYQKAIDYQNKALEIYNEYEDAYYYRGLSKQKLKDYYGAISDYTKAIELDPNFANAYNNRGVAKNDLKDYYGAISDHTKAIELNPNFANAYNNRGSCFYYINNFTKAKADSSKAIELDNTFARAYANRAFHNYELGLISNACADINQANLLGFDWDQAQLDDLIKKTNCNPN